MPITDLLTPVTSSASARPATDTLAAPGYTHGATSATLSAGTNWADGVVFFTIYTTTTIGSTVVKDPTTQTDWKATKSGTSLTNMILTGGSATQDYTTGAIVELTPTSRYAYDLYQWAIAHGNLDGSLKAAAVQTALGLGAGSLNGWNALGYTFSSVTANGNRSYTCVVSGQDVTGTLSAGMRLRTTRTVAAPTQATSLNGTNQYWSKTAPAGMTFTNNFVVSAWVKLTAYGTNIAIASRYDGTNGWYFDTNSSGQVRLVGANAGAGNFSLVQSYQSIPLNKWVHIAAQLDMATFTASPTTSYVMIDGLDAPTTVSRGGTNPTALVQAGSINIGANNAVSFWSGKIAQVAIYSAKVTQATILASMHQGLAGTETSLISAYSFNGNANDLNANANNLTANNAAAATNADSPFGGQADGTISSTLDYGIVTKTAFSTNTTINVQVPEGCTIPTSGGVASVAYSSVKVPYGFPANVDKWSLLMLIKVVVSATAATSSAWLGLGSGSSVLNVSIPVGSWRLRYSGITHVSAASGSFTASWLTLATAAAAETDSEMTGFAQASDNATTQNYSYMTREKTYSVATQAPYYLNIKSNNGTISVLELAGTQYACYVAAECAYL